MYTDGFICLRRDYETRFEWYDDINTNGLFLHLLLAMSDEPRKWHGLDLPKHSIVTTVAQLGAETGLSARNIRTALQHLSDSGHIKINTTNKNTIIHVVRAGEYIKEEHEVAKRERI